MPATLWTLHQTWGDSHRQYSSLFGWLGGLLFSYGLKIYLYCLEFDRS